MMAMRSFWERSSYLATMPSSVSRPVECSSANPPAGSIARLYTQGVVLQPRPEQGVALERIADRRIGEQAGQQRADARIEGEHPGTSVGANAASNGRAARAPSGSRPSARARIWNPRSPRRSSCRDRTEPTWAPAREHRCLTSAPRHSPTKSSIVAWSALAAHGRPAARLLRARGATHAAPPSDLGHQRCRPLSSCRIIGERAESTTT